MATAEQHRAISAQFLDQAEQEFERGDLLQASEKAWGAFSPLRERQSPDSAAGGLGRTGTLIENANSLISADPGNAEDRRRLVRSLEGLHANFYQSFLDEDSVRGGINDARELIEALASLETAT